MTQLIKLEILMMLMLMLYRILPVAPPENTTWVPLNFPHGPCSPLSGVPPSVAELLHHDQLRVDDILARLSGIPINDSKPGRGNDGAETRTSGKTIDIGAGSGGRGAAASVVYVVACYIGKETLSKFHLIY
jgi:hypothetical protein